jgi:hypothetical protein
MLIMLTDGNIRVNFLAAVKIKLNFLTAGANRVCRLAKDVL